MKRPTEDYATMGLNALKRAARKAFERARQNNLAVPIWRDGKVEYINSEAATEQAGEVAANPLRSLAATDPYRSA
jgi:hypothetical protein